MPNPNEKALVNPTEALMRRMLDQERGGDKTDLISEITALRQEVMQLREALLPPKSVIITGPDIERLYTALRKD